MKSRPEYRPVFNSRSMFFRALHTISTQRYRLPVRRYILGLFNVDLDYDVVQSLTDYAKSLRAPLSFKPLKSPGSRVVSIFGHLGHSHRTSESDEDELDVEDKKFEHPVISLRPQSTIVGFAI
jgi:rapamycin-insensitive companion of mTOR